MVSGYAATETASPEDVWFGKPTGPTLDTTQLPELYPIERSKWESKDTRTNGREAAAVAAVTCRQLGYSSAAVVMNCDSLMQLLATEEAAALHAAATESTTESVVGAANHSALLWDLCGISTSSTGHETNQPECKYWVGIGALPLTIRLVYMHGAFRSTQHHTETCSLQRTITNCAVAVTWPS